MSRHDHPSFRDAANIAKVAAIPYGHHGPLRADLRALPDDRPFPTRPHTVRTASRVGVAGAGRPGEVRTSPRNIVIPLAVFVVTLVALRRWWT